MIEERRTTEGRGLGWDVIHIAQGLLGLSLLWDLIAHSVNYLALMVRGGTVLPLIGLFRGVDILPGLCEKLLPPQFCIAIKVCIISGFVTYLVLKLICWTEWIKEEVTYEDCWEELRWYNPFTWVTTLVCVVVTTIQWVFQKICRYVGYIVLVAVIVCSIVAVWIVAT